MNTLPDTSSTALVKSHDGDHSFIIPDDLLAASQRFLGAARASNTKIARRADWTVFEAWCAGRELPALPARADTVFAFLVEQAATKKPATLKRYLASIAKAHGGAGLPDPTKDARVTEVVAGIRKTLGTRQRQAAPMVKEVLAVVQKHCDVRSWAIICFGQALAARRSELCALDRADVVITKKGAAVTIQRSKTDQESKGALIGIPRQGGAGCPVEALEAYLHERPLGPGGPLFYGPRGQRLTVKVVERAVKRAVAAAGLDAKEYSAHSLRAGYVTDRRREGVDWPVIMEHTRHERLETVKGYARYERDPFAGEEEPTKKGRGK